MTQRPNFEDLFEKAAGCYEVRCRCGQGLGCREALFDHWQRGHFDVFENEAPRAKKLGGGQMEADPGPDLGSPRALLDEIRSGVTELEVEVNRFELSRNASNDDVAKAVDAVSAELVLALARLRVTVREIANYGEHQVKESMGL